MPVKAAKNDYVTHQDLESFGERLGNKLRKEIVDDMSDVIAEFSQRVDERFNHVEFQIDKLQKRVVSLEARMEKIEKNLDRLTNTIDGFIKRLDEMETENAARDAQVARLERWIEQVAKKTGVKLEY